MESVHRKYLINKLIDKMNTCLSRNWTNKGFRLYCVNKIVHSVLEDIPCTVSIYTVCKESVTRHYPKTPKFVTRKCKIT